jgi:hypothetical protein
MKKAMRVILCVVGVYLAVISVEGFWFNPVLVSERAHEHISIGSKMSDIAKAFEIEGPFILPSSAYCGNDGPLNIAKIAVNDAGRVMLLPTSMVLVTTTTFCFDTSDKLVGMETERWMDNL